MTEIIHILKNLHRPRLLVRAARHGLKDYDRKRDLHRISGAIPSQDRALLIAHLVDQEEQIESTRQSGCATYSISRHIEILIALMHECRRLARTSHAV